MKKKLDAVFVVEGKNDALRLSRLYEADMIITGGLACPPETLATIARAAQNREIIIFTDPDSPGNRIRQKILQAAPNARQAFIPKEKALGRNKVGVEHASDETLREAIDHLCEGGTREPSLSYSDYVALGFTGQKNSAELRRKAAEALHLGFASGKTFYKWLNMAGVTKEELERILSDGL